MKFWLHSGGVKVNSLTNVLNLNDDNDEDDEQVEIITHSPYYYEDLIPTLKSKSNSFTILSSNINSINAKFSEIEAFVQNLKENDFELSIKCFQECSIKEDIDLSLVQLEGYNCVSQGQICSRKGGSIMYVSEKYNYTVIPIYSRSNVCEG